MTPLQRAKVARLIVATQRDQLAFALEAGALHVVADCKARHLKQLMALKNAFCNLHRTVPHAAGLSGDAAAATSAEIQRQVDAILGELARHVEENAKKPEPKGS